MASVAKLILRFSSGARPELLETVFDHPLLRGPRSSVRGKTYGALPGSGTFQWTPGVRALCLLLVQTAAERAALPGSIRGGAGSAAATLDYALGKQPVWLLEMFGTDKRGRVFARKLIRRTNPERKRPGPVVLSVNEALLPAANIEVRVDGIAINSQESLRALARMFLKYFPSDVDAPIIRTSVMPRPGRQAAITGRGLEAPLLHDCMRRMLVHEISSVLQVIDIFRPEKLHGALKRVEENPSFIKAGGRSRHVASEVDLSLSPSERIGWLGGGFCPKDRFPRSFQVATSFILPGAIALFQYLKQRYGIPLDLDFHYAYAQELVRKIVNNELAQPPELCILTIAPAANLMKHGKRTGYLPLMLMPPISHRVLAPAQERRKPRGTISANYLFLLRDPSTPEFYFEHLQRTGKVRGSEKTLHSEPDELPYALSGGNEDLRAVVFFPHYGLNQLYNSCVCADQPERGENFSESILFVHESFAEDKARMRLLDILLRDAWFKLRSSADAVSAVVSAMIEEGDFTALASRCCGVDAMINPPFDR